MKKSILCISLSCMSLMLTAATNFEIINDAEYPISIDGNKFLLPRNIEKSKEALIAISGITLQPGGKYRASLDATNLYQGLDIKMHNQRGQKKLTYTFNSTRPKIFVRYQGDGRLVPKRFVYNNIKGSQIIPVRQ